MFIVRNDDGLIAVRRKPTLLRARLSLLALVAMALVLAACGGHSKSATSKGSSSDVDWPYFNRDTNATRFAPQTQIDAGNLRDLGLAWSASLGPGQFLVEDYPLEVGGRLYVTTSTDEVEAYDAVTGRLLWQYAPQVDFSQSTGIGGFGVSTNRGVALDDGMLFALTFDDRLQAISQATGEELWSSTVADDATGAYETMAPTVYGGLVFVGVSGSQNGIRGFVAAYDEHTGRQVWRFWTVPAAGTAWVPEGGGGGGVYMPPTVDTRTGLLYVGTGPPAPVIYGVQRPGPDLYTDTILALNARTGKLAWYYQEVPHDLWNYGAASPVMVVDTRVHGRTVRAVAEAGKNGYVHVLDAATGKLVFAPTAYVREGHPPPTTTGTLVCPGSIGGSPYSPMALDPKLGAAYVTGVNLCQILKITKTGGGTGEQAFGGTRITPPGEKPTGTLEAVNLTTGRPLWQRAMPTPMIGGATTTASDLLFTGDQHGNLYAVDAKTGRTLWQANLGLAFGSAPIVYTINGTEYIAAAIGGSASTAANHLGPTGAKLDVLKLHGAPIP
jgi:PQQ-dependent dehydrogenase (methanol/ethanol family)